MKNKFSELAVQNIVDSHKTGNNQRDLAMVLKEITGLLPLNTFQKSSDELFWTIANNTAPILNNIFKSKEIHVFHDENFFRIAGDKAPYHWENEYSIFHPCVYKDVLDISLDNKGKKEALVTFSATQHSKGIFLFDKNGDQINGAKLFDEEGTFLSDLTAEENTSNGITCLVHHDAKNDTLQTFETVNGDVKEQVGVDYVIPNKDFFKAPYDPLKDLQNKKYDDDEYYDNLDDFMPQ